MSHGSSRDWDQLKPRVYEVLHNTFGFEAFRGVQEDAVKAILSGRDCLVLMPTGGGKSLCYALPAVVQGGLAVVVSPLIALMQDQVSALQSLGIAVDYLSSTRSAAEVKAVFAKLSAAAGRSSAAQQQLALLYVTPERLATDSFRQQLVSLHRASALQFLAVDEAHCISSWGHDFRPTYRQLAALRAQLPGLPCIALTATATAQVQQDIVLQLRLQKPVKLITSFNRPNIHYSVVLLDVQQAPATVALNTNAQGRTVRGMSASPQTASAAAAASPSKLDSSHIGHSAAAVAGQAGVGAELDVLQQGWGLAGAADGGEVGELDVDFAGYDHLLKLLSTPTASSNTSQQHTSRAPDGCISDSSHSKRWKGPVCIVYALKRSTVDSLVRRLSGAGFAVAGYHAALPDAVREGVLEDWRAGKLQVVIATVAFGMGVDKGDIELVVHINLPRTVEAFYQESGRAGRNEAPASSVLFYSTRDRRRMDWILQKDGEKKEARKHQKTAAGKHPASAVPSQPNQSVGSSATRNHSSNGDPATAAAALQAFGAVVDLCTQPGCRRARLLKHFGEDLSRNNTSTPQQQLSGSKHAGSSSDRCCDFCDNPGVVSSYTQQLKEVEVELLQWRTQRRRYISNKRQRGEGLFKNGWGVGSSDDDDDDDDERSKSGSDDSDGYLDPDAAAAAAAVARAAAAVKGAGGKAGTRGTDAFLSAMLIAEDRHNKQRQGDGPGGNILSRFMAAKEKQVSGNSAPVADDVRATRRSKLAEILASNKELQGCTADAAANVAVALEATVYQPGITAAQHSAGLRQLVSAIRSARGWLDLAEVEKLQANGLSTVLELAVEKAVKDAILLQKASNPPAEDVSKLAETLQRLAELPVTASVLEQSGVAGRVKSMRKHKDPTVAAAASQVISSWRSAVS